MDGNDSKFDGTATHGMHRQAARRNLEGRMPTNGTSTTVAPGALVWIDLLPFSAAAAAQSDETQAYSAKSSTPTTG
jgi:hypothetical protein